MRLERKRRLLLEMTVYVSTGKELLSRLFHTLAMRKQEISNKKWTVSK
jgi:hypothetical protein